MYTRNIPLEQCSDGFWEHFVYRNRSRIETGPDKNVNVPIYLQYILTALHFSPRPPPDAPVCSNLQNEVLGALKHETIMLKCEVDSNPPATSFHWTFNSSGEHTELPTRLHASQVGIPDYYQRTDIPSIQVSVHHHHSR